MIGQAKEETKLENLEHTGKLFFSEAVATTGSSLYFLWHTGNRPVHFISSNFSTLKTTYTVYEGVSYTVLGTSTTSYNRNRNFPDNSISLTQYFGSTFSGGTLLSTKQTGSTSSPGLGSQSPSIGSEAVLKPNTYYGFSIIPSATCDIALNFFFWEEY